MTNILSHLPANRGEAVVEGSINGVSATNSDKNVERSEAVTVTEAMDKVEEVQQRNSGNSSTQSNLGNYSSGVSGGVRRREKAKKKKKKEVLGLGDISTKPNWWQSILGAGGVVSDVQKKVVLDSGETSSNSPNSWLRTSPNSMLTDVQKKVEVVLDSGETSSNTPNSWLRTSPNSMLTDVQKKVVLDSGSPNSWLRTSPNSMLSINGELVVAGWPSWLCAVAGEAIYGWTPRRADSFEKIDKIGQGLRSNVYKARDLNTGKIVALKKVRFDNLEPESVKFMAREIIVLRRLDHPNVMKLEGVVTSKTSCSLYLVFEYMEHDLAGLANNPQIKFTELQVNFYMHQLLLGLEYCHSQGVLHRDINGSNLLIDKGILKIAGFGSASFFGPNCKLPMISQVTTLSYKPPEIIFGATDYGVGVDLWSVGFVLAELLAGKPIMTGKTEVEQLHKIFKLCGSPSEEYWKKSKLPLATKFKPEQPYKRCIAETFKDFPPSSLPLIETLLAIDPVERQTATAALRSEFFTVEPYACEPSDLPKYPSKEDVNAKHQEEKVRHRASGGKPNVDGQKKIHTCDRDVRAVPASEANVKLQANSESILGASLPGAVSDVQKKDVFDSGETSSNRPNSRLRTRPNPRLSNPPNHLNGELVAAGWPSWLCAVAGEAIYGWTPRRADSLEKKLNKIGQGRRSNVYKGRDLMTGKFVALKKVQFDNLKPESVKFMAREILMLRRLDHPNVIKLEGLVTSKTSCSLYLVFEYMEHDLAGLAENPGIKFTKPQVKFYMHQLLLGIEYCHCHGVLHRNINGSNLLIDNEGILKIAGFGSASFFDPNLQVPLTTRLVTLWYQPPEILFRLTDYGIGVDLWSMGCVLAELLAGKPIMTGKTEVEQLHKIFKLCGSPSEEYWEKSKLPLATKFKPEQPYKRCIAETFKDFPPSSLPLIETLLAIDPVERQTATAALRSEFFTVEPYACEPSDLPKYPSKEDVNARHQEEKARHRASGGKPNVDGQKKIHTRYRATRAVSASGANVKFQFNFEIFESNGKKIDYSGPTLALFGNSDQMLKDHEQQIREIPQRAWNAIVKVREAQAEGNQMPTVCRKSNYGRVAKPKTCD